MIRNYVIAAVMAVVVIASMQAVYLSKGTSQVSRNQGEIRLNTDGNEVGIADGEVCHYLIADGRVKCSTRGTSTQVIAVDQHSGTLRMSPGNGKYVGMFVKKSGQGVPGAGIDTYVYTAE